MSMTRNHIYCIGYIAVKLTYSDVEFPNFPVTSTPEPYFKFNGGWRGRDKLPYFTVHRAAKMLRPALCGWLMLVAIIVVEMNFVDIKSLGCLLSPHLTIKPATGGYFTPSADFVEVRKFAKLIERRFFETLLTII